MEIKTPRYGYTVQLEDPSKEVLVSARNVRASYRKSVELMDAIRGKRVKDVQAILEGVVNLERPIHYTKHRKHVPHHAGLRGPRGAEGGYPVNAAKQLQKLLDNALAVADSKVRRFFARARGQHDLKTRQLVHLELGLKEVS